MDASNEVSMKLLRDEHESFERDGNSNSTRLSPSSSSQGDRAHGNMCDTTGMALGRFNAWLRRPLFCSSQIVIAVGIFFLAWATWHGVQPSGGWEVPATIGVFVIGLAVNVMAGSFMLRSLD